MGAIVLLVILALIPAFIAKSKGRNFWEWFIYGILLWIVAFIHSLIIRPYETVDPYQSYDS